MDAAPAALFAGLATLDVVHRVTRLPAPDEKVRALSQELVAGGPAANAAVTYAALGGRATLLTALGGHALARVVRDELAGRGVDVVDLTPDVVGPPPVAACTVVDSTGERTVSSVGAASSSVAAPAVVDVADARVVLLDGHHPEVALAVARAAVLAGVPVVLDAGSWKPVLADLLPLVTVAACGGEFRVPGCDGDVLGSVLAAGASVAVMTAGPRPVRWRTATGAGKIAVRVVATADTLGAGDAFHGALAWALATRPGGALDATLSFAASVATLRCAVPGQRAWLMSERLAEVRTQWLTS